MHRNEVTLVGIDVGTTTTSALIATAELTESPVSGQTVLDNFYAVEVLGPIFTPMAGDANQTIDAEKLHDFLQDVLFHTHLKTHQVFSAGALITGLAAEKENANIVQAQIAALFDGAIMATADDPHYESWLAFMGSALDISKAYPTTYVVNIDIGGGTTNIAIGRAGQIVATGSYYIGARHVTFAAGKYELTSVSHVGQQVLEHIGIGKDVDKSLSEKNVQVLSQFYAEMLENILADEDVYAPLVQAKINLPNGFELSDALVTFSGGVGQLFYEQVTQPSVLMPSLYGDLGGELAEALFDSTLFAKTSFQGQQILPEQKGRSTLFGLAFHCSELTGSTIFLAKSHSLPLNDVPIVCRLDFDMPRDGIVDVLNVLSQFEAGAAVQVTGKVASAEQLMSFGQIVNQTLTALKETCPKPLVFLVPENIGQAMGQLITDWHNDHPQIFVFDEVPHRDARLMRAGHPIKGIVPVNYYDFGFQTMCIDKHIG